VVIPRSVRDKVAVNVGDLFEANVEKGKITLTPKSLVDRRTAKGLEDIEKGPRVRAVQLGRGGHGRVPEESCKDRQASKAGRVLNDAARLDRAL
jgi:bifunctional DNA-binding transcriptional regulator/antitoxin component of YhaV-PrlF toxin-antitoxin module